MILRARSWRGLLSRDDQSRKMFHVKRSQRASRAVFHVKQPKRGLFHVKQFLNPNPKLFINGLSGSSSFPDAELAKDHVENVLDIDPPQQPPQGIGRPAQLLRRQLLALSNHGRAAAQSLRSLLQ